VPPKNNIVKSATRSQCKKKNEKRAGEEERHPAAKTRGNSLGDKRVHLEGTGGQQIPTTALTNGTKREEKVGNP